MTNARFTAPPSAPDHAESAAMPHDPDATHSFAFGVLQEHEQELMAIPGVEGVGIGQDAIGNEGLVIYVRDAGVAAQLPKSLKGLHVECKVTGVIDALKA